jgi:hypothetical protein
MGKETGPNPEEQGKLSDKERWQKEWYAYYARRKQKESEYMDQGISQGFS